MTVEQLEKLIGKGISLGQKTSEGSICGCDQEQGCECDDSDSP